MIRRRSVRTLTPLLTPSLPRQGTAPDEWVPTPDGGWLVAMMGGPDAGGKGGIAKIDKNNKIVGESARGEILKHELAGPHLIDESRPRDG